MLLSSLSLFITLFAITNPIGNAAIFVALTQGVTRDEVVRLSIKTGIATFITLQASIIFGYPLLQAIGVSMNAFKFAGGLILLRVGFSLFSGTPDKSHYNEDEHKAQLGNLAVSPLAIPLIAGPGAMVSVIHYAHTMPQNLLSIMSVIGVTAAISCIVAACLYATTTHAFSRIMRNPSVVGVITRLCGLFIISIASQMILIAIKLFFF